MRDSLNLGELCRLWSFEISAIIDNSRRSRTTLGKCLAVVIALIVIAAPQVSHAASASELFADGNRLFRDDLYWAALLRYQQAADAGMDTPLLDYNIGVAHYRAQQYTRAREYLLRSSRYGPLQAVSHYNLGLNAYATGDKEQAKRWFESAREQRDSRQIRRLARKAISELEREQKRAEPEQVLAAAAPKEREFTNLRLRVRVGVGTDDNVYRTPSDSYVDLADSAQPVVNPIVQSGIYIPVSLSAKYQVNSLENEGFFGMYRIGGRQYQDDLLSNADEFLHELSFGSDYHSGGRRRGDTRERRVHSAFKIAQHQETYYDPDTGLERDVGGMNIADRLSYLRYGPEFWFRETIGSFSIGAGVEGQLWNYEDIEAVPSYDHEYWRIGLNTQFRLDESSLLRLTAEYYTRRFGQRPAFELDGTQPVGNPSIRYDYAEAGIQARQRITNAFWFGVNYKLTKRVDQYLGYNNYTRDLYGGEMHFNLGNRFDLELSADYRIYNYENAFAFHEPAAGRKTLEFGSAAAIITFDMTDHFSLVGEYQLRDVESTDTRIEYSRSQALLGIRWSP